MSLAIFADKNVQSLTYLQCDVVITMLELPNDELSMSERHSCPEVGQITMN